jgi:dienelactone hydrolase
VSDAALAGTRPLLPEGRSVFADRYAEQYARTLAWMRRALAEAARARDAERGSSAEWLADRRQRLAARAGGGLAPARGSAVTLSRPAGGEGSYAIATEPGLLYAGQLAEPVGQPRGLVVTAGHGPAEASELVERYRAAGLRVASPLLARPGRSFADDRERGWYHFGDDELLHLFSFVIGGSLAGLEAAELQATARSLSVGADGRPLPVALDARGRHVLTAVVAAALAPDLFDLLVLPEEAERLDSQAEDARVNTVWGFHADFDGLTLLALAAGARLLFVERGATPSALCARASLWLGSPARSVERLRLAEPDAEALAAAVAARLPPPDPGRPTGPGPAPGAEAAGGDAPTPAVDPAGPSDLYRRALASKLAFLEAGHAAARRARDKRYDTASLSAEQYRQRVAESVERVMGPPLPRAPDPAPRTRLVARRPSHDVYELVLESVPGVEVAAYLLVPLGAASAPAVVCQHGRGGRPESLIGLGEYPPDQWIYDRFAERLAEKGYVVVAPFMNWGMGSTPARDALVKPAYALGITPNRFESAQLATIVDFLVGRPEVAAERIGFYGLSYGGHASLWLGANEPRLAAVITAGYFNDLQTKLTSTEISPPQERPTSFISVDEGYDMFTYDVFEQLSHAELATRFAPRPYMVENGLRDRATPTAWVDREFGRVRAVFAAMGRPELSELEHFDGPHRVWAEASFQFLHRHLRGAR